MHENFKPNLKRAYDEAKKRKGISEPLNGLGAISTPGTPSHADGDTASARDDGLPDFISAAQIHPGRIKLPPLLIEHLLHREAKMVLGGGSKTYKSWALADLGLSVAAGVPWWNFPCRQGVVVYLNFELIQGFLEWRIYNICRAKNITLPSWFLYWNLRNKCYDLAKIARVLEARLQAWNWRVDLIIADPIYKALGGLDENSSSEMGLLMETIEKLSVHTGAAVVFGAHFSKGGQAQKEAKDRISGSGVFGRDPDAIVTMTKHSQEHSYAVESDLRYLPALPDFVVSWKFPLLHIDEGKDPRDLFMPGMRKASKNDDIPVNEEEVLTCLNLSGMIDSAWRDEVRVKYGRAGGPYYAAKAKLIEQQRVVKQGLRYLPTTYTLAQD